MELWLFIPMLNKLEKNLPSTDCCCLLFIIGIISNLVFPYICSFLLYLHQPMSVNINLEIKGYMRITFWG